ncbi:MAG: undecaprenyl-diphosphatase [Caldisericaceae bacterium]
MNVYFFELINGLAGKSALLDQIMIFAAKYLVGIIPIIIFLLWFNRTAESKRSAIFVTSAVGVALLLGYITKNIYYHPRPFAIGLGLDLVPDGPTSSFPSNHTTAMFALSFAIFFVKKYRLAVISFIMAFIVAISRIYIGVHFPFDILGGIVFGFIGTLLAFGIKKSLDTISDKAIIIERKMFVRGKQSW